jgi:hypothetical protein
VRYGFIAEDTAAVDVHLATYDASSTVSGIDDRSIIAILVGAVKDLANTVSETAHLVIDAITARVGNFGRVNTDELCVGQTRVTEEQFTSVFSNQAAAAGAPSSGVASEGPSGPSAAGEPNADKPSITPDDDSAATAMTTPMTSSGNGDNPVVAEDAIEAAEPEAEGLPRHDKSPQQLSVLECPKPPTKTNLRTSPRPAPIYTAAELPLNIRAVQHAVTSRLIAREPATVQAVIDFSRREENRHGPVSPKQRLARRAEARQSN